VPSTAPSQSSQKRKRPANDGDKIQSANLEKLMHKLKGDKGADGDSPRAPKRRRGSGSDAGEKGEGSSQSQPSKGIAEWGSWRKERKSSTSIISGPKKMKAKKNNLPVGQTNFTFKAKSPPTSAGLTSLQKDMKHSLDGARFRWINETLYKADSAKSHQMMQEDPKVFEEYHTGFRHQVQSWPTNPVSHYISALSTYPSKTVIADLGCGDAAIARALVPKGMIVLSFDLISDGAYVVEADTCGKLPLPGSEGLKGEKSEGEGHVVDVVVCALSLMGTNWPTCIQEAWRILKSGGELKIAEVASRFTDAEEFVSLVNAIGFKLKSKDESNSHFTLFEFRKISRKGKSEMEWAKLVSQSNLLKPCEYKRR